MRKRKNRAFACESLERRLQLDTTITGGVHTFATLADTVVTMTGKSELHVTAASNPLSGTTIHLNSPDAWLWLDNVKPSAVNSTYLSQVRVNGAAAVHGGNVRVVQYELGTVVIPHAPTFQPFQAFTGPNFSGTARSFNQYTKYNSANELGEQFNNVSSFKLKRGYMATVATQTSGGGASKVYIAQDHDLDVSILPSRYENTIEFIRVIPWRWVSKKGASDLGSGTLNAQWRYNWNNDQSSTLDAEYVPIRQQRYWPDLPGETQKDVTHLLGFNEPNNPVEDAYQSLDNGSVDTAISVWPELLSTGLRVGAPAVTDGGKGWLFEFMDKAIAAGLRVDYIPIHMYLAGQTATSVYNWLKDVYDRYQLPIWVTEFNNGANWTGGADPTYEQNAQKIGEFIEMYDTTPWIERYAVYSRVEWMRQMTYDSGGLTPAGQVYYDNESPISYVQEAVPSTNTASREVARLPLDGNALDASGHGNNGETVGAPDYVAGQRGQAIQLDGTSSYVRLPENIANSSAFSFAAWVYWEGGGDFQRVFDFGNSTSQFMYLTPSAGGKIRFGIRNGGGSTLNLETASALAANSWQHVAVTMQGTTARIYVNGVQQATGTLSASTLSGTSNNFLGKSQWPNDPLFRGRMDDVHIGDTVLSVTQLAGLMANTPPQFAAGTIARGPASRGAPFVGTIAGAASDADAADTITYAKANGPSWLSVAASGALSGTPGAGDRFPQEFVVTATDSKGAATWATLTIQLAEAYWRGDVGNSWSANNAGNTNWAADSAGMFDAGFIPDALTDLVFAASGAGNLPGTVLGGNVSARSVLVSSASGLTIGGTHHLTLGAGGLNIETDAGATTINTTGQLILGADQTWNNDSANALAVTSAIGGAGALTKTGAGTLTLSGNNAGFAGGTTIETGLVRVTGNNALGTGDTWIGPVGNATTARLEFSNNATLANEINLPMRNNPSVAIQNISGSNQLGPILLQVGGNTAIIQSDAGALTLAAISSAATGTRTPTLGGAGNGVVSGPISNGAGTVGIIKSGAGTWTLNGSNTYTGVTTVNGGTLLINGAHASGVTVAANGTLGGVGTVAGAIDVTGDLSPGNAIGQLRGASARLRAQSVFKVEFGGATNYDSLALTGALTIDAGSALNVSFPSGFSPAAGQVFDVITFGSATGRFSTYSGLQLANGLVLAPFYRGNSLRLLATLPGDANGDLRVNFTDFQRLERSFGLVTDWENGNFNLSGVVDHADFAILHQNFNSSAAAVPAPVAATVLKPVTPAIQSRPFSTKPISRRV